MKRTAMAQVTEALQEPGTEHKQESSSSWSGISISCYENDVPAFIENEMNTIYGSVYSTLTHFRIYNDDIDTSTYIVRKDGKITTIFLFCFEKRVVRVINEVLNVSEEDVERFTSYIFSTFPNITAISFKAIITNVKRLRFPYQRVNFLEDLVVTLPSTEEEYYESLAKSTRRHLKRFTKKIHENLPTFRFEVYEANEIDPQLVREIVSLNWTRMAGKNKESGINEEETERFIDLASQCGLVSVVTVNGKVCAGGIGFRTDTNYFLNVLAHDPSYDNYCLGIICCYMTICACIERGGKEFHFLWGRYDYKHILLGVKRDLDNVVVYRSYSYMLLNADMAMETAINGYVRRAKLWLYNGKKQDSALSKFAFVILDFIRNLRRQNQKTSIASK
jgi:hypothetical protein